MVALSNPQFKVGDTITMKLMMREKVCFYIISSTRPFPFLPFDMPSFIHMREGFIHCSVHSVFKQHLLKKLSMSWGRGERVYVVSTLLMMFLIPIIELSLLSCTTTS